MLMVHNYEFGDDKPDYLSETTSKYRQPNLNPNEITGNRINNQLLQKSNYKLGTDNEPLNTGQKISYTPKYSENEIKNIDLEKTNFILGDDKLDFNKHIYF